MFCLVVWNRSTISCWVSVVGWAKRSVTNPLYSGTSQAPGNSIFPHNLSCLHPNYLDLVRLRNYSKSITKTRRYESTKQDIEMNLVPFGRTWKILDTDFTDYTDFYFTNAAAFMKWKYCLNNINLIHSHPCNPCLKRKFIYYQVTDILFVFSVFRAFVIILFFFVCCTIWRVTAQVELFRHKRFSPF